MTTNYPAGTTPNNPDDRNINNPTAPANDAAWGCAWWWFLIIIIIILIIWFGGWGWGNHGGWWYRNRNAANGTGGSSIGPSRPVNNAPGGTGEGTTQPTSRPGMVLPSGVLVRF